MLRNLFFTWLGGNISLFSFGGNLVVNGYEISGNLISYVIPYNLGYGIIFAVCIFFVNLNRG